METNHVPASVIAALISTNGDTARAYDMLVSAGNRIDADTMSDMFADAATADTLPAIYIR